MDELADRRDGTDEAALREGVNIIRGLLDLVMLLNLYTVLQDYVKDPCFPLWTQPSVEELRPRLPSVDCHLNLQVVIWRSDTRNRLNGATFQAIDVPGHCSLHVRHAQHQEPLFSWNVSDWKASFQFCHR